METVGVIGGGQMGSQIAALAAMAGYETHVYDSDADNLKSKIKFTEDNLVNLILNNISTPLKLLMKQLITSHLLLKQLLKD